MTMPIENTMPGYMVYRDIPFGQPRCANDPLGFYPPKGSDELFDELRAAFPHLKTNSERMREAVISFYKQEQMEEKSQMATPQTTDTAATSPWLTSFPSMSTDSSTFSSPDMLDLATPSFSNSPQACHAPTVARQASATVSNNNSPPALENMTGVFSLSDSTQPKQRVRRKMTEAEKAEYRKRRIVKACDKCSKRKRKCVHNQPEMESLSKSTQKVEKAKPAAHHKKPSVIPMSLSPDPAPAADGFSAAQPFIEGDDWLDFTLLEDPLPEMTFDDLLAADVDKPLEKQQYIHYQQPWGADEDFSGMFTNNRPSQNPFDDQTHGSDLEMQQGLLFGDSHAEASAMGFTTGNKKYPVGVQPQQQLPSGAYRDGMMYSDLDIQQDVLGLGTQQHIHQRMPWEDHATSGDAMYFGDHFEGTVGDPSVYSGESAPRKELTRNIKNPIAGDVLHYFDGGDRSIHQSESTSKNRRDRYDQADHDPANHSQTEYDQRSDAQANVQNRTNVRNVEGSGTKDLSQAATRPQTLLKVSQQARESPKQTIGASHSIDVATEMYRLKHGVPGPNPDLQDGSRTRQLISRTNGPVNGGAYLRLDTRDTQDTPTPSLTGLSAILPATGGVEKPARTRTRNASGSNSPGDSFERGGSSAHSEDTGASGTEHSSRPRAHGRSPMEATTTLNPILCTIADSSNAFYQERLHDTVRRRDHFGRLALTICATALAGMLLCSLAQSSSLSISTSSLLLALFAPPDAFSKQMFGKRKRESYRKVAGGGEAGNGQSDKFFGWVMTPHSSLRWSVGTICA